MTKNQQAQTPTKTPSGSDSGEPVDPLALAHAAQRKKHAEFAALPEHRQIRERVNEAVRKAGKSLSGHRSVARYLSAYRKDLTAEEIEAVMRYLETQFAEVKEAAYGSKSEKTQFSL